MIRYIHLKILHMLCCCVLLAGCSPFIENNTIEEIAPVIFWSISQGQNDKIKINTVVPPMIQEKKQLLSMEVDLLKEGEKEFNLIYYRELKSGQLRMVLINEELARQGINSLINTFLTDPDIHQRLYLAIVKGDFEKYIENQIDKQENLDYFLYQMFKHYEEQGNMSIVNLHQFKNKLYSPVADPFLPVFKTTETDFIYEGTAFFSKDKLIASIKHMDEQIFQLIGHKYYLKNLTIPGLSVSLGQVRAHVKTELSQDLSTLSVIVNLNGRIEEYRGDKNILEPDNLEALNHEIELYLAEQTKGLLDNMQKWQVDPLEIGTLSLHPLKKPLSEQEWKESWDKMKITVGYDIYLEPLMNTKD
ncbi:Ger(x)C family spore germination protein [Alkalihalobacterium alkalinitrilicum]|uniref:Ger(x)C family spore germination protein n=1 Tax=Alkalihalobacterium alkalinitrilicum TaxID=427920 RepID=UPI000995AC55|nr:Ger(x)C family spore germination protein [Alkalihalobacterium alkalinitrilicum]